MNRISRYKQITTRREEKRKNAIQTWIISDQSLFRHFWMRLARKKKRNDNFFNAFFSSFLLLFSTYLILRTNYNYILSTTITKANMCRKKNCVNIKRYFFFTYTFSIYFKYTRHGLIWQSNKYSIDCLSVQKSIGGRYVLISLCVCVCRFLLCCFLHFSLYSFPLRRL